MQNMSVQSERTPARAEGKESLSPVKQSWDGSLHLEFGAWQHATTKLR